MRFTGHNATSPINDYCYENSTSSTPTSPAVTTTLNNCLILRLGAFDGDDITVDDPGLSGHSAITMDKSAASGSTPVAVLGSWLTGTTHTRESGTNRALIFIAHGERGGSMNLSSVTYGRQSMTKIIEKNYSTSGTYAYVAAYILNEAGIAAASSSSFSPTWSIMPTEYGYASVFLSNVNQSDLVGGSASNGSGSTPATITTSALATSNGDMVIAAATAGERNSYTFNNGFTQRVNQLSNSVMDSSSGAVGNKSATGVNETPSVTFSGSLNRQVLIGFVVQGAGATGTVSGGAGYVRQSTSGDSATSTFSLGSSKAARALTIAIAPANQDIYCGGQIRP
jgi:hypothetical protein